MTLLERLTSWVIADDTLSAYLSSVDEEIDAGEEAAHVLYPPVPARSTP